jgi:predicted enzyme related to lactoylglutathione lyase
VSNGFQSQLVFCNVPARDAGALVPFYSTLLDVDTSAFVHNGESPIDQYETPITGSGIDLLVSLRNEDREVTTTYWAVSDIRAAIQQLTESEGGVLVAGPTEMPDGGTTAALLDPEGNYVGLVQLAGHAKKYFRFGEVHRDERLRRRRKQLRAAVAR